MIMRYGAIMQSLIQGFVVLSVYEQSKSMERIIPLNVFVTGKYFEQWVEAVDKIQYWSDKCKYENQGELNAKRELDIFLRNVFKIEDAKLTDYSDHGWMTINK